MFRMLRKMYRALGLVVVKLAPIIIPGLATNELRTKIGRGYIIGAGTVVKGKIPDFSVVVGSPGRIVRDSREYICSQFARR